MSEYSTDYCEVCGRVYPVTTSVERFRGLCYDCFEKAVAKEEAKESQAIDDKMDRRALWTDKWKEQE